MKYESSAWILVRSGKMVRPVLNKPLQTQHMALCIVHNDNRIAERIVTFSKRYTFVWLHNLAAQAITFKNCILTCFPKQKQQQKNYCSSITVIVAYFKMIFNKQHHKLVQLFHFFVRMTWTYIDSILDTITKLSINSIFTFQSLQKLSAVSVL